MLCCGATKPRDLPVEGRELNGVHFAMEFLTTNTQGLLELKDVTRFETAAKNKDVVVIGGGDTGTDCVGTSVRHGCSTVTQLEIMPRPPDERAPDNPWPEWPRVYRVASAHEEGGERKYAISTTKFIGDDNRRLKAIEVVTVDQNERANGSSEFIEVKGTKREIPCELVLLAMGFTGPYLWDNIKESGIK